MKQRVHHRATILILLVILSTIFGLSFTLNKYVMMHHVALWDYAFWQAIGPAMLLFFFSGIRKISFKINMTYCRYYIITALLGIIIPNTILYFVAPHLSAGILGLIVNTVPILIFPLSLLFRVEKFEYYRLGGLILGMIGVGFVILSHQALGDAHLNDWLGLAWVSPFCYALCIVYIAKYRPSSSSSITLSAGMLLVSAIVLAPVAILSQQWHWIFYPMPRVDQVIVVQIILSGIGYVLIVELIQKAGPIFYSFVNILTVIAAFLWGQVFFSEPFTGYQLIAMILVFCAIAVMALKVQRQTTDRVN